MDYSTCWRYSSEQNDRSSAIKEFIFQHREIDDIARKNPHGYLEAGCLKQNNTHAKAVKKELEVLQEQKANAVGIHRMRN